MLLSRGSKFYRSHRFSLRSANTKFVNCLPPRTPSVRDWRGPTFQGDRRYGPTVSSWLSNARLSDAIHPHTPRSSQSATALFGSDSGAISGIGFEEEARTQVGNMLRRAGLICSKVESRKIHPKKGDPGEIDVFFYINMKLAAYCDEKMPWIALNANKNIKCSAKKRGLLWFDITPRMKNVLSSLGLTQDSEEHIIKAVIGEVYSGRTDSIKFLEKKIVQLERKVGQYVNRIRKNGEHLGDFDVTEVIFSALLVVKESKEDREHRNRLKESIGDYVIENKKKLPNIFRLFQAGGLKILSLSPEETPTFTLLKMKDIEISDLQNDVQNANNRIRVLENAAAKSDDGELKLAKQMLAVVVAAFFTLVAVLAAFLAYFIANK